MDVRLVCEVENLASYKNELHLDTSFSNCFSAVEIENSIDAKDFLRMPTNCLLSQPIVRNSPGRTRSASTGRDKKLDFRAQNWASSFKILEHTIYQLYRTCEVDESISECKEVILVLEGYTRDFYDLAKRFREKCEHDSALPLQRPTSLAWGVSKSSPGKIFRKSCQPKYDSPACRQLIYERDAAEKNTEEKVTKDAPTANSNAEETSSQSENTSKSSSSSINGHVIAQPANVKTKLAKVCGAQANEDNNSIVKRNTTIARKNVANSPSYTRKCVVRTSSSSSASSNSVSSVISSRATSTASPSKPNHGFNLSAPVFVPRKKLNTLSKSVDSKLNVDSATKSKMARSNSDTICETNQCVSKNRPAAETKSTVNSESVAAATKDDPELKLPNGDSETELTNHRVHVEIKIQPEDAHVTNEKNTSDVEANENENLVGRAKDGNTEPPQVIGLQTIAEMSPFTDTSNQLKQKENVDEDEQSAAFRKPPTIVSSSAAGVEKTSNSPFVLKSAPEKKPVANKVDVRKKPLRNHTATHPNRTNNSQWDMKAPTVARKVNASAATSSASKSTNQNYFKNVAVPKGSSSNSRNDKLPNPTSSTSARTESAEGKLPKSNCTRSSYSTATKSNVKEFNDRTRKNINNLNQYPKMVRSKTEMSMETTPKVAVKVSSNEEHESSPRKRSFKGADGWETVISRSRRFVSNYMNKRFNEPSPSTSMPSLPLPDKEKSPDTSKCEKSRNRHRNVSHGSGNSCSTAATERKDEKVNGGGVPDYKLNKERPIISSTAMFTALSPKKKKAWEKNSKKAKSKENKRKSSKESDSLSSTKDIKNEGSPLKRKTSKEKERNVDDFEIDADFDLESDSTEMDSEATELGKEYSSSEKRNLLEIKYSHLLSNMNWADQVEAVAKLEKMLDERDPSCKSLKYAKRIRSLEQFEDFMLRWPGRASELHQKLSSPSRKRFSPDSTILQHKARQAKAKQNREQYLQHKAAKMKEEFDKVAEVRAKQKINVVERLKNLDEKLKRAEENRNLHLKNIQEKAHDEAKKQKEIAFINKLEAQNKRHNLNAQIQEQEDRFQNILEERQRRREEEKAAKEAAVEERRKAIEAGRQAQIEEIQERRRKREERVDRELQMKEIERLKMVREKARDREERLQSLQAAQIASAEELQRKIQRKHEKSARRYEESIELIRQRASEIGTPRLIPYQINKLCYICNVLIDSEVFLISHLRGANHQEAMKKYREQLEAGAKFSELSIILDAPADILQEKKSKEKERQKMLRKRCKKIRQRLNSRNEKYAEKTNDLKEQTKKADTPNKKRMLRSIKELEKLISTHSDGVWPNNSVAMLERNLFEITRVIENGNEYDQQAFKDFDGFSMLSKINNYAIDLPKNMSPYLPLKCFVVASNLYTAACAKNIDNCIHVFMSNNIVQILEFLLNRLNLIMPNSDDRNGTVVYKADTVADVLMKLCTIILSNVTSASKKLTEEVSELTTDICKHLQDIVSYIVCAGIVDKLAVYCSSVHDDKSTDSFFLLHAIQLLTCLVETRPCKVSEKDDSTSLLATLKATELVGAVSMLYAMLLHQDSMSPDTQICIAALQPDVVSVIVATLKFFSRVGELNLQVFQDILGAEGISLQVRHITSYLLKFCVQNETYDDLLHLVIEFLGFFAIHHYENQMILQSGSTPTVLQQLLNLPFAYFSNPELSRILFPTLLACCVNNTENKLILEKEMSFQLLEDFKKLPESKNITLIKLIN